MFSSIKPLHNPKPFGHWSGVVGIKGERPEQETHSAFFPAFQQPKMRAIFFIALVGAASALSIPIVSQALGNLPLLGPILGGTGGSSGLLNNLPIVGNLLNTVGGVLGQLLNNILVNVGIILNAVLNIADEALGAVNVIVNGLLTNILDDATVQQILAILPAPVQALVSNLVQAVKCIVNDLQAAVPAVQKAVIQLVGLLVSPAFALLDENAQLSAILNIIGNLTQDEVTVVNTILQRLADALNNKTCSTGPVTMPTLPSLPGVSGLPGLGGSLPSTPSVGGLPGLGSLGL